MSMTSYAQKKLLDHLLNIAAYTASIPYLSLHTASPTDSGSHAAEVSTTSTGYARQSLAANMGATDATTGVSTNSNTLTFGPALTDWGIMTFLGIEDALTSGNMLMWGSPTAARTIIAGQSFQFVPSQLSIRFD